MLAQHVLGNPQEVLKVLEAGGATGDFRGGAAIQEEEQKELWKVIRAYGVMLADIYTDLDQFPPNSPVGRAGRAARFSARSSTGGSSTLVPGGATMQVHGSGAIAGHYDQMYIHDTMTTGATEGTEDVNQYDNKPAVFGRRVFACVKLRTSHAETTEFYFRSIENGRLEQDLRASMLPRIMHDFEDLAINGDTGTAVGGRRGALLSQNMGWLNQTDAQAPTVDAAGLFIEWQHFQSAAKTVPQEYTMSADMRWWMHPHLWQDWVQFLQAQAIDVVAAGALGGTGLSPLGFSSVLVPLLPIDRPFTNAATPGRQLSTNPGPYQFEVAANTIVIDQDDFGGAAVTVTFPTIADANEENRTLTTQRVANLINAAIVAQEGAAFNGIARVDQHGYLELVTTSTGAAALQTIGAGSTGLVTLGFAAGTDAGAVTGDLEEGSMIWFSPAWNFVWHVVTAPPGSSSNGLRMFTQFQQSSDRIETDIYTWQDATLFDPTALVQVNNVHVARPGTEAVNP